MFRFNIGDYLRDQKDYATGRLYRTIEKAIKVIKESQWVEEDEYDDYCDNKGENSDSNGYIGRPEYVKRLQDRLKELKQR